MNVKIPGNKTYALGTLAAAAGGGGLVMPESIAEMPLPTDIASATGIILLVLGLGFVFLRQAIAKLEK